jgi:hypothetical protein
MEKRLMTINFFLLNEENIQQLLASINNAEGKKAIEIYLKERMDSEPGTRRVDAILRGLLKIGETVL